MYQNSDRARRCVSPKDVALAVPVEVAGAGDLPFRLDGGNFQNNRRSSPRSWPDGDRAVVVFLHRISATRVGG